ncbi:aminopeptidase P family protein [Dethiosulfovibrio sp. F2B]|uniref:M24 family metallopeptidase n=1 Tax=Dethiosulfovibrio faecalis TaxID=2720018 RepID=UPI001F3FDBB9|nr:aminopeptidase P family protein [Dethiosulfovibrio faecalis]MCF4151527.1 aminopeptidase P family protein [Dethiosulfovibrio faecalis]
MNRTRLDAVLASMEKKGIPQMIVSDPCAIFYLTGKWILPGERMLALYLDLKGKHRLFINELFPVEEDLGLDMVWYNDTQDPVPMLTKFTDHDGVMGVDKNWPARFLLKLMKSGGASDFVNGSEIVDKVRMCKDEMEKDLMRTSSKLNDSAMDRMIGLVPKKYTEKKMGKMLGDIWEELGADGHSFDPIVGYGANAADPHHVMDDSLVKEGDCVIIDIGCRFQSYCSDMTRTVFYRSVSDHAREVYEIVREANMRGIEKVKAGVRFCDIDGAARDYITEKGYGKYFTHRLGHSIGIEDHEFGDVSPVNTDVVMPGQIFSIEPGIYLPGDIGVRIEDLVIATEDGCEVLNGYTKDLIVVD